MGQDYHSGNWYRVASVRPRLAGHMQAQRQMYRGVAWYVLIDSVNQRSLRLTPAAWHVVARMDGQRTVQALWDDAVLRLGAAAPPQDELIGLLTQLHETDALLSDVVPDLDELLRRRDRQRGEAWKRSLMNPLSIRLRLWDPDAFLVRTLPALRWVFGPAGLLLWLAICLPALALTGLHWTALTHNASDKLLSAGNLLSLFFVYPVVKALHEMAHAYAAKWGGAAVHDMGLMFLVFAPVPYVDASGSSAFADKRRRALVAAAGMLMELLLGALALYVWLAVEPGVVRSLAYNVMLIGGVSTLLFNGNPLLRYDGYFVLCDLIETPNLAQRANQLWMFWLRRYAFGLTQAQPPHATAGERRWMAVYAPLSLAYRVGITVGIALFLGHEYLYVGLAVGVWGLLMLLAWPLLKGLRYLWNSQEIAGRRARPWAVSGIGVALLAVLMFGMPAPLTIYAQGVVWPAENAQLRAAEPGLVSVVAVKPGEAVLTGQLALKLRNDKLSTELDAASARDDKQRLGYLTTLAGLRRGSAAEQAGRGRVALAVQQQDWQRASDEYTHAEANLARLDVAVRRDGRIELPRAEDLPGRWLKKGELFGHIVTGDAPTVRVVVPQDDIDLVRAQLLRVEVRLSGDLGHVWPATVLREVPAGEDALPSMALALDGGGLIAVDARDANRPRALNRIFQFDLLLPPGAAAAQIGERAHVHFVHAAEPLGSQILRRLRQLLLTQLAL